MRIVDSHFHWWPRQIFDRSAGARAIPGPRATARAATPIGASAGVGARFNLGAEWFDLDQQLAHMDGLGHQVDVVCSIGPFSVHFSDLPPEEGAMPPWPGTRRWPGRSAAHPGRLWASAAVPLVDTRIALEVLDHAVNKLGLMGANLPGSVGSDPRIDAERLEPFYDRVEELGMPLFLHPTDALFPGMPRRL